MRGHGSKSRDLYTILAYGNKIRVNMADLLAARIDPIRVKRQRIFLELLTKLEGLSWPK